MVSRVGCKLAHAPIGGTTRYVPPLNCILHRLISGLLSQLQIIVCADGAAGINFEHTGVDGHTVLRSASPSPPLFLSNPDASPHPASQPTYSPKASCSSPAPSTPPPPPSSTPPSPPTQSPTAPLVANPLPLVSLLLPSTIAPPRSSNGISPPSSGWGCDSLRPG